MNVSVCVCVCGVCEIRNRMCCYWMLHESEDVTGVGLGVSEDEIVHRIRIVHQ